MDQIAVSGVLYTKGLEHKLVKYMLLVHDKRAQVTNNQYVSYAFLSPAGTMYILNGWQLAKMKKSIPDMSLPWNL